MFILHGFVNPWGDLFGQVGLQIYLKYFILGGGFMKHPKGVLFGGLFCKTSQCVLKTTSVQVYHSGRWFHETPGCLILEVLFQNTSGDVYF